MNFDCDHHGGVAPFPGQETIDSMIQLELYSTCSLTTLIYFVTSLKVNSRYRV